MSMRYLSFIVLSTSSSLRPAATGPGTPQAADGSADEREEQGEEARDREDRPQPLLRGSLLGALLRPLGQGDARELVYKAHSYEPTHYRQHNRDHKGEQGHQNPVLEARAARGASCDVAADQER